MTFKKTLATLLVGGALLFGGNKAKGVLVENLQFDVQPNPVYLSEPATASLGFDFVKEGDEFFDHFAYKISLLARVTPGPYTQVSSEQYELLIPNTTKFSQNMQFDEMIPYDYRCMDQADLIAKIENLQPDNPNYAQFPTTYTNFVFVEIIPEPSTLGLLGLGGLFLMKRKSKENETER